MSRRSIEYSVLFMALVMAGVSREAARLPGAGRSGIL
jgi:hypothetical protein